MQRWRLVAAAGAIAVIALAIGAWLGQRAAAPVASGTPAAPPPSAPVKAEIAAPRAPRAAPAVVATPAPAHNGATPPASAPLPALHTPVAQIYDDLAARARAGDGKAACRLAADLLGCRMLSTVREQRDGLDRTLLVESSKPQPSQARLKQMLASQNQITGQLADLEHRCSDLPPERTDEAFDWLKLAAESGNVPAMARFAIDPMIPFGRMLRDLDRMMLYRDRAPALAQAAVAAGNVEILSALADAYGPKNASFNTFLSQVTPSDPVRAFAYQLLSRRVNSVAVTTNTDQLEQQRAQLDLDQQRQAENIADDLYRRYYAGLAPSTKPSAPADGADPSFCERER